MVTWPPPELDAGAEPGDCRPAELWALPPPPELDEVPELPDLLEPPDVPVLPEVPEDVLDWLVLA